MVHDLIWLSVAIPSIPESCNFKNITHNKSQFTFNQSCLKVLDCIYRYTIIEIIIFNIYFNMACGSNLLHYRSISTSLTETKKNID